MTNNIAKQKIKEYLKNIDLTEVESIRLNDELSNISYVNASSILLLKYISDYAKENNEYVFYRGYIYNSYICYLLGITDINPLDEQYYLYSEFLYGINHEKNISLNVNVSIEFKSKLLKYLNDLLHGNIFKAIVKNGDEIQFHPTKYIIFLDEHNYKFSYDENNEKYIEEDCFLIKEPFIKLHLCEMDALYQMNNLINKYDYPSYNILEDKKISEVLLKENKTAGIFKKITNDFRDNFIPVDFNTYINYCGSLTVYTIYSDYTYFKKEIQKDILVVNKYPTTRDRIAKTLINLDIDKNTAIKIVEMLIRGKNYREINKEKWLTYVDVLKKHINDESLLNYLLNIDYLFPLGHVIAYAKLDYLLTYYKINYSDFYDIMLGENLQNYSNLSLKEAKDILNKDSELEYHNHYYLEIYIEKLECNNH